MFRIIIEWINDELVEDRIIIQENRWIWRNWIFFDNQILPISKNTSSGQFFKTRK